VSRPLFAPALAGCVGALLLTACTGPAPHLTVTASPTPAASSTAPAASPTPTPAVPPAHVYAFGDEWTTNPPSQAQGSGCTPGAGQLPDGVWFGFAKSWSTSQIAFDMACWWTGDAAVAQATVRGEEAYDYYVTNDNTTVRLVTVAGDIPAKKAAADDGTFTLSQVIADPGGSLPTSSPYPVWIYVNGGRVTELAVQYVP
jgi:hypothetical protein